MGFSVLHLAVSLWLWISFVSGSALLRDIWPLLVATSVSLGASLSVSASCPWVSKGSEVSFRNPGSSVFVVELLGGEYTMWGVLWEV